MAERRCISIQIGQCGIQMGNTMWELFCLEHGLNPDGKISKTSIHPENDKSGLFFSRLGDKFIPRSVLADLEPSILNQVRNGPYKDLYDPDFMVSGTEDAASNFGRGYYTIGKDKLDAAMNCVRKIAERSDAIEGFLLFHSCGGGTGSGFATLLMNNIVNEFRKKSRLEFSVFPAPQVSSSVVEPYNAVLSLHSSLKYEHADCTFYIDNESLYNIAQKKLNIGRPNFRTLNRLCAQAVSSITTSLRFGGLLNVEMSEFKLNLVPFPTLHFPVITYSPIITNEKAFHEQLGVKNITSDLFSQDNQLVKCDLKKGTFIACCLLYRGDVVPKDINDAVRVMKSRKDVHFVDWCPTGIKVGVNAQPPRKFPNDTNTADVKRAVCMLANSTAIVELWERVGKKFDVMLKERAFTHWYLREGVEQHEFVEARKDLEMLKADYNEIQSNIVQTKTENEF